MELLLTPLASLVAETVTHPIDFVKTRRQVLKHNVSVLTIGAETWRTSGIMGFYPAIVPTVIRHWVYTTLRVGIYERVRTDDASIPTKIFAGLFAGGFAQALASPTDLVKVRMQVNTLTGTKQYTGVMDVIQKVYKKDGFWGFYQGWKPNVLRAMAVNVGELVAYDSSKNWLRRYMPDQMPLHILSSIYSGFWATFCSTPADVLKSRLMAAGGNISMTSCFADTVRKEGVMAMWKGFLPNWIRLAPWQLIFWVSYEFFRKTAGIGQFR